MNASFSDEHLSAYLDDELSNSQRAEVDAHLASSDEARQRLAELRTVSQLVSSLPAIPAPFELRVAVMQSAERQMLLGTATLAGSKATAPARHWRGWASMFALIASTIVVAVSVHLLEPSSPDALMDSQKTSANIELSPAGASTQPEEFAAVEAADATTLQSDTIRQERAATSVAVAELAEQPAESDASAADGLADRTVSVTRSASQLVFDHASLNGAQVGDVIQAMKHSEEEVAVVRLTVVDRQDGLERLQLLLTENHIPTRNDSRPEAATTGILSAREQLTAVYVESDSDQLSAALEKILHDQRFRRLELEEPIQLADLDAKARAQMAARPAGIDRESSARRSEADAIPEADAAALADNRIQQKGAASPRPAPEASGTRSLARNQSVPADSQSKAVSGSATTNAVRLPATASRQTQVALSPDLLARGRRSGSAQAELRSPEQSSVRTTKSARLDLDGATLVKPRLMQVLFVLVPGNVPSVPATTKPAVLPQENDRPARPQENGAA